MLISQVGPQVDKTPQVKEGNWLKKWWTWRNQRRQDPTVCYVAEQSLEFVNLINESLNGKTDPQTELEHARLLEIMVQADRHRHATENFFLMADTCRKALSAQPPKLILAKSIRCQLQLDLLKKHGAKLTRLIIWLSGGSQTVMVVSALFAAALVYGAIVTGLSYLPINGKWLFSMEFGTSVFAAFLGGCISILLRLRDFSESYDVDPTFFFWTAFFKPLIGVVLAIFIYCVLYSGVIEASFLKIPADVKPETKLYAFWFVVGFLAGFSERFASDVISRAETKFGNGNGNQSPSQ